MPFSGAITAVVYRDTQTNLEHPVKPGLAAPNVVLFPGNEMLTSHEEMFQVSTKTRVPVEDPEIVAGSGLLTNVNSLWVPRSVTGSIGRFA